MTPTKDPKIVVDEALHHVLKIEAAKKKISLKRLIHALLVKGAADLKAGKIKIDAA